MNDRADIRLVGSDGVTLFRDRRAATLGYGDDFSARKAEGGAARAYQRIIFPRAVYDRVRTQRVRVEIDYSLTLFELEAANAVAAVEGDGRFAAFGWCKTKIDDDGDEIAVGCVNTGRAPTCVSMTLDNPTNGKRNPANLHCDPDYAPYPVHVYPDAMSQLGGGIRFRDIRGLAKYPVDGSQLADARVLLKSYRPEAHFTRRLVIPDIRLSEWTANAADREDGPH